jgi:hypothetical protein
MDAKQLKKRSWTFGSNIGEGDKDQMLSSGFGKMGIFS